MQDGLTALMFAIANGQESIVASLIAAGANLDMKDRTASEACASWSIHSISHVYTIVGTHLGHAHKDIS